MRLDGITKIKVLILGNRRSAFYLDFVYKLKVVDRLYTKEIQYRSILSLGVDLVCTKKGIGFAISKMIEK